MLNDLSVSPRQNAPTRTWWLALAAISLLAFAFRFYRLGDMPPGLHYDEAFNGLDAYALLSTPLPQWPLFFTGNFGREPLHIYMLALAQATFDPSALTLRLVPALVGTLLTPTLAWLAWELSPSLRVRNRQRFSLWAGAAALTMLWSQVFARYAIRIELFALMEVLVWAALWRAWRGNRIRWWAIAGILAGVSFYSYLPVRILPLALIPIIILALWRYRPQLAARWRGVFLAAGTAALVAAPLAFYFLRNPLSFSTRSGQVNILDQGGLPALWRNLLATLGMAFVQGDANARNNIPGRPVLDWLMAAPFLLGLVYLIRYLLRPAALFLLSWLAVMLLPTILSDYAPAYHRAIGAMPVFALLIALGLETAAAWLEKRQGQAGGWVQWAGWAWLLAGVILTWLAFARWSALPDLFYARDVRFQMLGQRLAESDPNSTIYISPRGADHPTVRYTLLSQPATPDLRGFDGGICVRIPQDGRAEYVFLDAEDTRGPGLISSYLHGAPRSPAISDFDDRTWASTLRGDAPPVFPEMIAFPQSLSDGIKLNGYWLSQEALQPGERLYVRLFWQADAAPAQDYTTFVHLLRANPDGGLEWLAGSDSRPGGGSCPTDDWRPGEFVVDELQFAIPDNLSPTGAYFLALGFYTAADGQRLPIPGQSDDQILIGPQPAVGSG
ncbi:MAG: hypothetical protein J5I90_09825 [Caldilineales bacterium]|nr:hypothetical protein [Caldilineales bacterium]